MGDEFNLGEFSISDDEIINLDGDLMSKGKCSQSIGHWCFNVVQVRPLIVNRALPQSWVTLKGFKSVGRFY